MLVVRFRETFRERMPEWAMSAGMLGWGMLALASSSQDLFVKQDFFHPLLNIMPQFEWGALAILVGFIRLVFLVINGAWTPSAHIRAIGCFCGTMLWGALFIAALSLGWLTPTSAMYFTLLSLDVLSLWFSAGDAKLAELSARGKVRMSNGAVVTT